MKLYASETYAELETIQIAGKEFTNLELTEGTPDLADGGVVAGIDLNMTAGVDFTARGGLKVGVKDSTIDLSGMESGIGFKGEGGSQIAFEDATIKNAKYGATHANDGYADFKNVNFENNTTDTHGSAIYAKGVTTVTGGNFLNNQASSGHGGAIFNSGATLTVTGSKFTNNTAINGGAIKVDKNAVISEAIFTSNNAGKGGAVSVEGSAVISGSTFTENSASAYMNAGGAICVNGSAATLNVSDSLFAGNRTTGKADYGHDHSWGGAINIENCAEVLIDGATFLQNSATHGGAIRISAGSNITVKNSLFEGNTGSGGAISFEKALTIIGSTFATASDTLVFGSSVTATFGGANVINSGIYSTGTVLLADNAEFIFKNTDNAVIISNTVTIAFGEDGDDDNDTADFGFTFGGSKTVDFGNVLDLTGKNVTITVTKELLESSLVNIAEDITGIASVKVGENTYSIGETFELDGGHYSLANSGNILSVSSRKYDTVYVDLDGNGVTVDGVKITKGVFASASDASAALAPGGTLFYDGENASTFVTYGVGNVGYVNSVFHDNVHTSHGSAIKIIGDGAHLFLNDVKFINNSSTTQVGAVWVEAKATAEIKNTLFAGNKVQGSNGAGAIFMDSAAGTAVTLSGTTFLTETDTVLNQTDLTFQNKNYVNATVYNKGTVHFAEGAEIIFGNTTGITMQGTLDFQGSNGLVFNGSATVAFNDADLSNVAITVSADIFNNAGAVIVSGITTLADGKVITVKNGDEIVGEYKVGKEFSYNGDKYAFVSNGNLTFDKSKPEVVYVQLDGSGEVVIGGKTISEGVFNTIDEAKANLASGGTLYVYNLNETSRQTFDDSVTTVYVDGKISGSDVREDTLDGGALIVHSGSLTISGGTYSNNAARWGGAIRNDAKLLIKDTLFAGNEVSEHGSALAVFAALEIDGATFSGNKSPGAGAVWVNTSAAVTIKNTLFDGNTGSASGALHLDHDATVIGSTFATASDTIAFGTAGKVLSFGGENILNANIGANGVVNLQDNAVFRFENSEGITIQSALAFAGDGDDADDVASYGMTFKGTGLVTFAAGTDLSNVNITVDATLPVVEADFITVAANVAEIDLNKVFIGNEAVGTDGEIMVNGLKYTVELINNSLVVSRYADKHDVTYAQLNGTGVVEGVEVGIYDTVDKAEKYVNAGGTVNILNMENSSTRYEFSATGPQSLTIFDNAYFHDITVGRNSVMRLNANQEVVVTNSTFANNASVDPGSGHNSALGFNSGAATVSVKNSKFLDNSAATIIGALLFNANTGVVENCYFSGNTANGERNGAAIYVDDGGNVTVSGSTFATTSDQVYSRGASFTFSGENTTAASICHHYSIAAGLYGTMTMAENATLKFVNTELIEVNNLTFAGNNTLTFAGSAAVDFWNLDWTDSENYTIDDVDLSSVNITVDTTGFNGGFKTIATGVSAFDADKVNSGEYQMMLVNNKLMLHDSTVNEISDSGIRETNNGTDLLTTIAGDYNGKVFGGSKNGSDGALLIDFKSGTVNGNIVGGGEVGATSTAIEISGTAVAKKSVYAGIFATTAGLDTESSSLTISGGSIESYVTGGSRVHNVQHHTDLVTVTIDGGDFADGVDVFNAGFLVGNGTAAGNEATLTVSKAVTNLAGATISGEVYGGASVQKNGYAKVDDVEINISGGTYANVFGGGWAQQGSRSDVRSVNITIDGGYVANLYAGGNNAAVENNQFSTSTVTGDVTITAEGGKFGNIYLCGKYTGSAVLGDITLTLDGGRTVDLISGISVNGLADNDSITKVEITSGSKVTCSAIDTIDMLVIDENAMLTLDSINNVSEISFNTDGGTWDAMVTADFDTLNFADTTFALGEWSGNWSDLLANYGSIENVVKDGEETGLKKLVITLA